MHKRYKIPRAEADCECGWCVDARRRAANRASVVWVGLIIACMVGLLIAAAAVPGCASTRIDGGKAKRDVQATLVEIDGQGGVIVTSSRDTVATTQPSVRAQGPHTPRVGAAADGELGAIAFDQVTRTMADKNAWPMFIIFALAAGAFAYLRKWIWSAGSLAIGILAALFPWALGLAAAAVIAVLLYFGWQYFRQIKVSLTTAREKAPTAAESVLTIAREQMDVSLQKAMNVKE
jgi:hypothetical protein